MKNTILFGASNLGVTAFNMLKYEYNIIAYVDNDPNKWDKEICGIKIKDPKELLNLKNDIEIIITSIYYTDIKNQLDSMGIENYSNFHTLYKHKDYKCKKFLKKNVEIEVLDYFRTINRDEVNKVTNIWMDHIKTPEGQYNVINKFNKNINRVLVMACGCGTAVFHGLLKGYDVYGIDPEEWKLNFIKMKIEELGYPEEYNKRFIKAYGEELPFEDGFFDAVICYYTLEHVNDYRKCVEEMIRVTTKKGVVFIQCPDYNGTYESHYKTGYLPFMNKYIFSLYLKFINRPLEGLRYINFINKKDFIKVIKNYKSTYGEELEVINLSEPKSKLKTIKDMFKKEKAISYCLIKQ